MSGNVAVSSLTETEAAIDQSLSRFVASETPFVACRFVWPINPTQPMPYRKLLSVDQRYLNSHHLIPVLGLQLPLVYVALETLVRIRIDSWAALNLAKQTLVVSKGFEVGRGSRSCGVYHSARQLLLHRFGS